MTTDPQAVPKDSPSISIAHQFWELAKEEFESENVFEQKDACEKAFRAATEAVDTLIASHGITIPAGEAQTHSLRANALNELNNLEHEIFEISNLYSRYKDHLHGYCFYGTHNPLKYKNLFFTLPDFINKVSLLLE